VSTGIALLFLGPSALDGGEGASPTPRPPLPPGKTRYPLYRRLGGPQGRSGRAENLVPTGIRSRTVHPVVQSLYRLSHPAHTHTHRHIYIYICTYVYIYVHIYLYMCTCIYGAAVLIFSKPTSISPEAVVRYTAVASLRHR